jgi:hypothetical protein
MLIVAIFALENTIASTYKTHISSTAQARLTGRLLSL